MTLCIYYYQSPVPKQSWRGVWNATYYRSQCVQRDLVTEEVAGSEDCLYMNVYRPNLSEQKRLLPVIVFVVGIGFISGNADPDIYGADYFMDTGDVVMVTMQYRQGVFGFLAANDECCKGNFGLKDQSLALAWVHKNIWVFGGDPQRVTVMGQASGAVSVQFQLISKRSNGLFQRAVMMSGSALSFWAIERRPAVQFRKYASIAGVPRAEEAEPAEIIQELRNRTAYELFSFQELLTSPTWLPVFRPVVEEQWAGAFITKDPEIVWKSGCYEQRPFLIGGTGYEEGSFADLYYNHTQRSELLEHWTTSTAKLFEVPESSLEPLFQFYFDGQPTEENAINFLKIRSWLFDYPIYKTVKYYTRYADLRRHPVDQYKFNFTSSFSFSLLTSSYPVEGRGASRGDDLLYLFPMKLIEPLLFREAPEVAMKDFWVRFMVDYAVHGRHYLTTKRCRKEDMEKGNCEFTDIQRDFSKEPNGVRVSTSTAIDLDEVRANEAVDCLVRARD